jgi:hypothetical protein
LTFPAACRLLRAGEAGSTTAVTLLTVSPYCKEIPSLTATNSLLPTKLLL